MRKIIAPIITIALILFIPILVNSQQNKEDEKFQKFVAGYFDAHWKFFPTLATLAGYHKYDDKLEDLGNKNVEKHHEALDKFNEELVAGVDKLKLSPELQIEHEMMADALDLELLDHEGLIPWEYNPLYYNNIFSHCVRNLLTKEFAPAETRALNAAERLKDLPKLIKQAKENLKTPPQLFTETAIKQFPAIIGYYTTELPGLIESFPQAAKSKAQENLAKVIPALQDYERYLQNDLLPRSTGNMRLGEQAHRRYIRLKFKNSIPINELLAIAKADYRNIRNEMFFVCVPFYKIMDPKIDLKNPPPNLTEDQLYNVVISHVFERLKQESNATKEYVERIKASVEEIKNFLTKNSLLELPEEELNIQVMPTECQRSSWTRILTPGAYDTAGDYTVQISQMSEDWDQEKRTDFLKEYNDFMLYFWTVRYVYPGQFVPLYYTQRNSSIVQKLYPNLPLIKGWPCYIEGILPTSGFGNYDLRLRLNELKFRLRAAIDFQLDFNIHEGGMTKEQAIAYMTRGGFQTVAEAERKWNYIILNPGEAAYVYVGFQEILDMEKDYKALKGESFDRKEFLQKLLEHGSLPIRHLKKKMQER